MKGIALLILGSLVLSCNQSAEIPRLSGSYTVGGFTVTNNMEVAGGQLTSILEGTRYAFDFPTGDTLRIHPKLAKTYFSDSVFQYKIKNQALHLVGSNGEYVIPYTYTGDIINLFINKNGIDTLQIMPLVN